MRALFGPAGNSESFINAGYKTNVQVPQYLNSIGLDAYEYQCGRGVRVSEKLASEFKTYAQKYDIAISLHAPYYISMSSVDEEKRLNSINYILQSAKAVDMLSGNRIIVHSGSCSKMTREQALALATDTMEKAIEALDENNLSHISICPETMGKINQLGTLYEVVELCKVDERIIPCIDFGHLNARNQGSIKTQKDFLEILQYIEDHLGYDRLKKFHVHFSKIEYTIGGEKKHLTFEDSVFGPEFEPFCEAFLSKNCAPVIICESSGTQSEDALFMKNTYLEFKKDYQSGKDEL